MHLLVTDRLVCPRCGPPFGLILLADRITERRAWEGALGCSNCRERYPITEGVGDLRPPPRSPLLPAPEASSSSRPTPPAIPVAAALGVGEGSALVLLVGSAAALGPALAVAMPEGVEVVTATPGAPASRSPTAPAAADLSRLVVGSTLPFHDGTIHGVVVDGAEASLPRLREAVRVLARGHRVVVLDPPADVRSRLGGAGLTRFVEGAGVVAGGR